MSLESIPLERFYNKLPLCSAWIGYRKSGKSLSASMVIRYLVSRNSFKRIILFLGNEYCNPELVKLVKHKFDERLIFTRFSEELLSTIIKQQKKLRDISEDNTLLIVFDDVYTARGRNGEMMNKIFQSGRHFLISCIVLAVSWSDIAPSCRRSLDFAILYSNITLYDTDFLTKTFLNRNLIPKAKYALKTNSLYTALCIETSPVQKLFLLKFKKKNKDSTQINPVSVGRSNEIPQEESTKSREELVDIMDEAPNEKILKVI